MTIPVQIQQIIKRLKKPSVLLSLVSQIASLCILFGFNVNENMVMSVTTIVCSVLVTLGIMSNPDTKKNGYGDDVLTCSTSGDKEVHVNVNGQMVCANCGAVYVPATGE